MTKKILTLFLSLILVASMLITPIIADDSPDNTDPVTEALTIGPGGLDFYSITIYYDTPTVVEYEYVNRDTSSRNDLIWYINKDGKKAYKDGFIFAEPTDRYVLRAGDTRETGYTMYKARPTATVTNFNGIRSDSIENYARYSTFPTRNAYITHIQDDTSIYSKQSIFLKGITRITDDAGNINPNYELTSDGYVKTVDNVYKIDNNGFLLHEGDVWKDKDGNIIELFTEDPDDNTKLVHETKYDSDGRVRFLNPSEPLFLYRVHEKADGKYTHDDIIRDDKGRLLPGEPIQGEPAFKTKIAKITIELDAMGTEIYSDLSQDPQQNNEVILTLHEWYEKILIDQYNAPKNKKGEIVKPEDIKGKIIGSVKSQTTKTEANFTDKNKELTYVSIDFDLSDEVLASLPSQAVIFLTFKVSEHQAEEAYDAKKSVDMVTAYEQLPEKKEPIIVSDRNWLLIGSIAGAVVLIAVIVIIVVSLSKKKAKNTED